MRRFLVVLALFGRFRRRSLGRRRGTGKLPGVPRGLAHLRQPLVHHFGIADRFDAAAESLETHASAQAGRKVLLHDLIVAVVIRRPEEFAGHAAPIDHLEAALGRLHLDIGAVEPPAEVADAFERVARGECKRLIINMPPRHTKSEFASYLLPAWFLGKFPKKKVMQVSNTAELAEGFGRKVRNLLDTEEYR